MLKNPNVLLLSFSCGSQRNNLYYATIGTMLLLDSSGVPYSDFQLLEFSPHIMVSIE